MTLYIFIKKQPTGKTEHGHLLDDRLIPETLGNELGRALGVMETLRAADLLAFQCVDQKVDLGSGVNIM